jgi:hypothetical protein
VIGFSHKSSEKDSGSSPYDCQDVTIIRNTKLRGMVDERGIRTPGLLIANEEKSKLRLGATVT